MVKSVSETVLKPEHYLLKTPLPIANKLGKKLKGQDNEHNTYNEVFHSHLQWMGSKKLSIFKSHQLGNKTCLSKKLLFK